MSNERISISVSQLPRSVDLTTKKACAEFEAGVRRCFDKFEFGGAGGLHRAWISIVYNFDDEMAIALKGAGSIEHEPLIFLSYQDLPETSKQDEYSLQKLRAWFAPVARDARRDIFGHDINRIAVIVSFTDPRHRSRLDNKPAYGAKPDARKVAGPNGGKGEEDELGLFIPQQPRHRLEQVILPACTMQEIHETLAIVRCRDTIYNKWGFSEIDPEPKAILNFFGPSGTGKTMCAQAIAHAVGCMILALNYADIESKYVGDAPKKLVKAFESAAAAGAVLFFDEADSFLGRRISNVTSSSDQAVNSLRSQMLIQLERFQGIVIFATNLVSNYDRAFETRILKHLKFELPNETARCDIISRTIPSKVPFNTGLRPATPQILELSQISDGFSGRDIKLAVLKTLSAAAVKEKTELTFEDFKTGFANHKVERERLANELAPPKPKLPPETKAAIEEKIRTNLAGENPPPTPPRI